MSKKSMRFTDHTDRRSKAEREADKALHQSKLDHKKKVLEKLGLDKILTVH